MQPPRTTTTTTAGETIQNFRPARGLDGVYRCAKPDGLAVAKNDESEAARIVRNEAGLIVDLRSASERNQTQCDQWMRETGSFVVQDGRYDRVEGQRICLRLDPLSPEKILAYLDNWMTPDEKRQALWYKLVSGDKLHNLRMDVWNRNGLKGLNEAILECGKDELKEGLMALVQHREVSASPAVVHCVQGKDRTGLLVMLCQSVLGIPDEDILADYNESERTFGETAAAAVVQGKLDRRVFRGAPKPVMEWTLSYLREKHGSVEGYLNHIGFDDMWQNRLRKALGSPVSSKL